MKTMTSVENVDGGMSCDTSEIINTELGGWKASPMKVPEYFRFRPMVATSLAAIKKQIWGPEYYRLIEELGSKDAAKKRCEELVKGILQFEESVHASPKVLVLGTARDRAMAVVIRDILQCFAKVSVACHLGCANGAARTGVMGAVSTYFTQAWQGDFELAKKASLALVPLLFEGQVTEPLYDPRVDLQSHDWIKSDEKRKQVCRICPMHSTMQTRTACGLLCFPRNVVKVFCPGGYGTTEEMGTDFLAFQMRNAIQTPYTGYPDDCIPNSIFLDHRMDDFGRKGWFWDGVITHAKNMYAISSIDPGDMPVVEVFRIGKEPRRKLKNDGGLKINIQYFNTPLMAAVEIVKRAKHTCMKQEKWFASTQD